MSPDRMTTEQARELLPLYVAGRLTADERRAIEVHLAADSDLREDLQFWRAVAQNSRAREDGEAGTHVSSEILVRFAEDPTALDEDDRERVSAHLLECPECQSDLSQLQRSLTVRSGFSRWRFAAAAVVTIGALGTLWAIWPTPDSRQSGPRVVALDVPYVESYRSADEDIPPVELRIASKTDSVVIRVTAPLPFQRAAILHWAQTGPDGLQTNLEGPVNVARDPDGYTIATFQLPAALYPVKGKYTLVATTPDDGDFVYNLDVHRD